MIDKKTERNIRVELRYDELMKSGRRGHYETLFQVVREEVESAYLAGAEQMRERVLLALPGGYSVDPQAFADTVRALPLDDANTGGNNG